MRSPPRRPSDFGWQLRQGTKNPWLVSSILKTSVKLSAMLGSGINGIITKVIQDKMDTVSAHVTPLTFLS